MTHQVVGDLSYLRDAEVVKLTVRLDTTGGRLNALKKEKRNGLDRFSPFI